MKIECKITLVDNLSKKSLLINKIKIREDTIYQTKIMTLNLWIDQGNALLDLQAQENCSQNALTKLTGISKASVYNYITLAKDKRIKSLLNGDHHGGHLECFNQKKLLKLTKLDNSAFEESIKTGTIVVTSKQTAVHKAHPSSRGKPVIQIDLNNQEVARYKSAAMAQKMTGISRMSIGKVCRGVKDRNHAGGYKWKFANK